MAERRMMAKKIIEVDKFMELPASAQALYLHLNMCSDDDGFCDQVTISMFRAHASTQDLQSLLEKEYIYRFESGVVVIRHWRSSNTLRADRYSKTVHIAEASLIFLDAGSGVYYLEHDIPDGIETTRITDVKAGKKAKLSAPDITCIQQKEGLDTKCIQPVSSEKDAWQPSGNHLATTRQPTVTNLEPQDSIGKYRLDKDSIYNTSYSAEPESSTAMKKPFITFPCIKGESFDVTDEYLEQLKGYYPGLDVEQQIRNMRSWIDGNPNSRKTASGMKRFITNWLNREQNRARPAQAQQETERGHGFKERDYDWDEIRRKLSE